ncbi:MMPL family transporter [Streptomyces sp. JJ36]|uniref:MMPL family transporter n=1 Tax=Streptomyces sp. JJ36 TaxID=2736645 RepID=UPI001F01D80A|nr:MMPL family transporter [Streptomyces sp. JJ36]
MAATAEQGFAGRVGRAGGWAADHARIVMLVWIGVTLALGAFAPRVEHALSGAGWYASGSESVQARQVVQQRFRGQGSYALQVVVSSSRLTVSDQAFAGTVGEVRRILSGEPAVSQVIAPRPGVTISPDRHTAVVVGGSARSPDDMVRAAKDVQGPLAAAASEDIRVDLTGAAGMWADFNEANKSAMLKSEVLSWPVTLAILLLAFGSVVAAGLPLMLTIVGLVCAAGMLYLGTLLFDISIWAMNFALMFALALGIDYALFVVARFRRALEEGSDARQAVVTAMETAGKAVAFSGLTVLVSLSAVMLVPSPAFRSMALGIMLAVVFVLAASLTLLPAVLGMLGRRVNRFRPPFTRGRMHRSGRLASWAARTWRRPVLTGLAGVGLVAALAWPVAGLETGMPSITVVPEGEQARQGYQQLQQAFGTGAPARLQIVVPSGEAGAAVRVVRTDPGVASVQPLQRSGDTTLIQAVPRGSPSGDEVSATIQRLRSDLPDGALLGGTAAENVDLEQKLTEVTPYVIGVVLLLGFLLLLFALRAPVVAAVSVLLNVLATLAAFGIAKWIFQEGVGHELLGFEPQGYLDAWAPVFFFAMLFALAMDYTVFLLAVTKEQWDRSADAREATVEGLATSGKVITAAAGVMIAVFFTFALSGPLPPKEMGVILGLGVLIDASIVRLLLMPVVLRLLGRHAWWLPASLDRVLPDVRFGH